MRYLLLECRKTYLKDDVRCLDELREEVYVSNPVYTGVLNLLSIPNLKSAIARPYTLLFFELHFPSTPAHSRIYLNSVTIATIFQRKRFLTTSHSFICPTFRTSLILL